MNWKSITAIGVGALLIGALGGAFAFPNTIVDKQIVNNTIEVEKLVNQTVEIEVPVDNGNLDLVLEHLYDNEGNVAYLLDDLKEDDISLITDRIIFVNEIKKLSVDAINEELFDELDNKDVNGTILDDKEMSRLRINDRDYEIGVSVDDFKDGEAKTTVTGTFEQDNVLYNFEAELDFDDGEFDGFDNVDVTIA